MSSSVDVLMPVFNVASTIEESVRSILSQTITDFRIVLVDDGSTDGTGEILRRMAGEDCRITVITTENRGIVDALNTGIEACEAPIIARLDGDDLSFPDRLQRQLGYLQDNPDCIAVAGNVWHIDEHGNRTGVRSFFPAEVVSDPYRAHCTEPYLMHPFLMVRSEALRKVGGYRYVFHAEDTDLYWRLSDVGRLHNLPDLLGEYRIHDKSVSGRSILNGRVQAVSSQLSAVSERRRRAGQPDIAFPRDALQQYHQAEELDRIVACASQQLTNEERDWLELAVASKLLQLVSYRPYALTSRDKHFIKSAIARHHHLLPAEEKIQLVLRRIVAHKLRRGDPKAIAELTSFGTVAAALAVLPAGALAASGRMLRKRKAQA